VLIARALKTPHCHACCEEKSSSHASAPCGVAIATSTLRSCCTPRCSRNPDECRGSAHNAPNGVAVATSVYLCPGDPCRHAVGGTPPQDGTCTAPTLGAGWCRVNPTASGFHGVERPSSPRLRRDKSLDFFESLTGSFSSNHPVSRRRRDSSKRGRRPLPTPPTCPAIARRATADWRLSGTRAEDKARTIGVRASARTSVLLTMPTRHPLDPGGIPSVPSSKLGQHTPHSAPQGSGQMPPRQPSRSDRDAFGPASRPSCPPCRHVAAFQTKRAHPPPLTRPRAPFNWPTATRKTTSEAFPEDRPSCRLGSGQGIRFAGYPDHHRSRHSAGETQILPRRHRSGLVAQSR